MKYFKAGYYSAMAVFLLFGLASGIREFFLLFFVMLFLVLVAFGLTLWTVLSFSYVQELSVNAVVKGDSPELSIGIYNDKPFPFTRMRILVETPSPSETFELNFSLAPSSHIYYTIPLPCPYRGEYSVGMTKIEINDIFGLLTIRFDLRRLSYYRQRVLKIYPKLQQLSHLPAHRTDEKEAVGNIQRVSEEGESFFDTRKHQYGDPLGRVHRIVSVQKRELYVKRYDTPLETTTLIAIDTGSFSHTGENALAYADICCETATAIAHYSLRGGHQVRILDASPKTIPQRGETLTDFPFLYDYLALLPFDREGNIVEKINREIRQLSNLETLYLLTQRQDKEVVELISQLNARGVQVTTFVPLVGKEKPVPQTLQAGKQIYLSSSSEIRKALEGVL